MRKTTGKLRLAKQTIRNLSNTHLGRVYGGLRAVTDTCGCDDDNTVGCYTADCPPPPTADCPWGGGGRTAKDCGSVGSAATCGCQSF